MTPSPEGVKPPTIPPLQHIKPRQPEGGGKR